MRQPIIGSFEIKNDMFVIDSRTQTQRKHKMVVILADEKGDLRMLSSVDGTIHTSQNAFKVTRSWLLIEVNSMSSFDVRAKISFYEGGLEWRYSVSSGLAFTHTNE
jgi:hypothetical protein